MLNNKDYHIFFDTEFTHLGKDCELISIGIVAENFEIYAEITDYDESKCSDFVKTNVIPNLYLEKTEIVMTDDNIQLFRIKDTKDNVGLIITRLMLFNWFRYNKPIVPVSDVCQYDMILLTDLLKLEENSDWFCPACIDINMMIWDRSKSYTTAFNMSREEIIKDINIKGEKHNSLYDAKVIKAIYDKITSTL